MPRKLWDKILLLTGQFAHIAVSFVAELFFYFGSQPGSRKSVWLSVSHAIQEEGVGTMPTQVTTPHGMRLETPHNAFECMEHAAGRTYRRQRSRTDGTSNDSGDGGNSDGAHNGGE